MEWLKIAVRRSTLARAIEALLASSTNRHQEARQTRDKKRSLELRREGDADAEAHKEMWGASHEEAVVHNESVTASHNSAPTMVNHNKIGVGEKSRDLIIATVLALSIMVNVVLAGLYLSSQRSVVDAYKDIKTQVWVRQDKDDERFQKFISGPYAQQMADIRFDEMLRQQQLLTCKEKVK